MKKEKVFVAFFTPILLLVPLSIYGLVINSSIWPNSQAILHDPVFWLTVAADCGRVSAISLVAVGLAILVNR